jgi:predicted nucleic acid-binding protein
VEGAREALHKAADEGVIKVSAVSSAEVLATASEGGFEPAARLLDSFGIVPVDKGVAERAGLLLARGRGGKPDLGRCLIAATCWQLEAVLVTKDRSRYPRDGFEVLVADY